MEDVAMHDPVNEDDCSYARHSIATIEETEEVWESANNGSDDDLILGVGECYGHQYQTKHHC